MCPISSRHSSLTGKVPMIQTILPARAGNRWFFGLFTVHIYFQNQRNMVTSMKVMGSHKFSAMLRVASLNPMLRSIITVKLCKIIYVCGLCPSSLMHQIIKLKQQLPG